MARKAVAATLASILLFTALVVADSTVMAAEENLASSARSSQVVAREELLAGYAAGAAALGALAQVQTYLASVPADCAYLPQYVSSVSASSTVSREDSGINYSSRAALSGASPSGPQGADGDNLTTLSPFSGYRHDSLLLWVALDTKEVGGGGLVSLEKHELHLLNLPIAPGSASFLCASALGSLGAALSRSSCNATLAQAAFESVMPPLIAEAGMRGFHLTAGWQSTGASCSASYWITLVQSGVEGVTGGFDWTVRGSGATE